MKKNIDSCVNAITAVDLQKKLDEKNDVILIDVREPWEHEAFNIGGFSLPLNTLNENTHLINQQGTVVIYCQKGIRSHIAIQRLQAKYGYTNLLNLSGGIDAWRTQFLFDSHDY